MRMSTVESATRFSRRTQGLPPIPESPLEDPSPHSEVSDGSEQGAFEAQGAPGSSTAFDNATFGASQEDPTVPPHQLAAILGQLNSRLQDLDRKVEDLAQHQQPPPDLREQQPPQQGGAYSAETTASATHPSKGKGKAPAAPSFVDHAFFRSHIREGFESQRPSKLAACRPHMYQIHDEITRALTGIRFQAKLTEYRVTCVNGFFLSCANAALLELIQEIEEGSPERARLVKMYNTYTVLEDLMRDRKTLLATRSDPNASDTMVAFADNCLSTRAFRERHRLLRPLRGGHHVLRLL